MSNTPNLPYPNRNKECLNEASKSLLLIRYQIVQMVASSGSKEPWRCVASGEMRHLEAYLHKWRHDADVFFATSPTSTEDTGALVPPSTFVDGGDIRLPCEMLVEAYQREHALLLRPYLYICLQSSLTENLRQNIPNSSEYRLQEVVSSASECLRLTLAYILRCQQGNACSISNDHHSASRPLSDSHNKQNNCNSVDYGLKQRSSFSGCLLLLAAFHARLKAAQGRAEYVHCLGLILPDGWHEAIHAQIVILSSQEEGSFLWQCGRQLRLLDRESLKDQVHPPQA